MNFKYIYIYKELFFKKKKLVQKVELTSSYLPHLNFCLWGMNDRLRCKVVTQPYEPGLLLESSAVLGDTQDRSVALALLSKRILTRLSKCLVSVPFGGL